MSTPSTQHPQFPGPPDEPQDDRNPGVLLLEFDEETKTTAELLGDGKCWRICDWELMSFGTEGQAWVPRWWSSMRVEHVAALHAHAATLAAAGPAPEQPKLDLPEALRPLPKSDHGEWWCSNGLAKPLHTEKDGAHVQWDGDTPMCRVPGCGHPLDRAPF